MNWKRSDWPILLAAGLLPLVLLTFYVAAYWKRLESARGAQVEFIDERSVVTMRFPTAWEDRIFAPALWLHQRLHVDSLLQRLGLEFFIGLPNTGICSPPDWIVLCSKSD